VALFGRMKTKQIKNKFNLRNDLMLKKIKYLLMSLLIACSVQAGQYSLYLENDVFYKTDRYYSHGTELSYTTDDLYEYSLGQCMYTPNDKEALTPPPGDRPYAGWLYVGYGKIIPKNRWEHFIKLDAGIVGPHSYAEQTQTFIHEMIGNEVPKGWDSQIPDTFAFTLLENSSYAIFDNKYFNIYPYVELAGGNLMSYAGGGIKMVAGYNVERDMHNQMSIKAVNQKVFKCFGFVGIKERYVFNNMLLTGDDFITGRYDYEYGVEIEPLVQDIELGICLQYQRFQIQFTENIRSAEYKDQYDDPKEFGSVKVSYSF
jgi:lipid A 3-O-deacylase